MEVFWQSVADSAYWGPFGAVCSILGAALTVFFSWRSSCSASAARMASQEVFESMTQSNSISNLENIRGEYSQLIAAIRDEKFEKSVENLVNIRSSLIISERIAPNVGLDYARMMVEVNATIQDCERQLQNLKTFIRDKKLATLSDFHNQMKDVERVIADIKAKADESNV